MSGKTNPRHAEHVLAPVRPLLPKWQVPWEF